MGTNKYKASVYLTEDEERLLTEMAEKYRVTKSQALIWGIQSLAGFNPTPTAPVPIIPTTTTGIDETRVTELIDSSKVELLKKIEALEEMVGRSFSELLELSNSRVEFERRLSEIAGKIEDRDREAIESDLLPSTGVNRDSLPPIFEESVSNDKPSDKPLSNKSVGEIIGVDGTTIGRWLKGQKPTRGTKDKYTLLHDRYRHTPDGWVKK